MIINWGREKEMASSTNSFDSNVLAFLSDADFEYMVATKHAAEEALGWKLLPENTVYRVDKISPIQTKWGSRCIVQLRNAIGQELKVWAPINVVRDLKSGFKLNGKDCLAFIKSLGEKETDVMGEPKRKFTDFETVYFPQVTAVNNNNNNNSNSISEPCPVGPGESINETNIFF